MNIVQFAKNWLFVSCFGLLLTGASYAGRGTEIAKTVPDLDELSKIPALVHKNLQRIPCQVPDLLDFDKEKFPVHQSCGKGDWEITLFRFTLPKHRNTLKDLAPAFEHLFAIAAERAYQNHVRLFGKSKIFSKKEYFLFTIKYFKGRIEFDEPAEGYILVQHSEHENKSLLVGMGMFTAFCTWAKDFQWKLTEDKKGYNGELTLALSSLQRTQAEDHQEFPNIVELSFLCSVGYGSKILTFILNRLRADEGEPFLYVVLSSLGPAVSFYEEKFAFTKVGARSLQMREISPPSKKRKTAPRRKRGRKRKRLNKTNANRCRLVEEGYIHWTNPNQKITSTRRPSTMMALPLFDSLKRRPAPETLPSLPRNPCDVPQNEAFNNCPITNAPNEGYGCEAEKSLVSEPEPPKKRRRRRRRRTFACPYCHSEFSSGYYGRGHVIGCKKNPDRDAAAVTCRYCGHESKVPHHMQKHVIGCKKNPNRNVAAVTCQSCGQVLSMPFHLQEHVIGCEEHPNYDADAVTCRFCPSKFSTPSTKRGHEIGCEGNPHRDASAVTCRYCGLELGNPSSMRAHAKGCMENQNRDASKLDCPYCPRKFTWTNNLKRHLTGCTENPNYDASAVTCPHNCGLVLSSVDSMQTHAAGCKENLNRDASKLDCPYCGKDFIWSHNMQRHAKVCERKRKRARLQ